MEPVKNVLELLQRLKSDNFANTEEAFIYLSSLVGSEVQIRCEFTRLGDKTEYKTRFGYLNDALVKRVLLTTNRKANNFDNLLLQQCNGLILEYPSWKVLALPTPMFNPVFRWNQLRDLDKYKIYEIKDGTTVNMYWYENRWVLSSANGYEVNDYKFLGDNTYYNAIIDIAAEKYPEFKFEKLDKSRCYTIGFHHPDFQPLPTDGKNMWFIQSCNLDQLNQGVLDVQYTSDIDVPAQSPITIPENINLNDWLKTRNAEALTRYFHTNRPGENTTKPDIHYGFILRGEFETHAQFTNLMLESSLLTQIRRLVYNLPKNKYSNIVPATPPERITYITLRSYLSPRSKWNYLNLFPADIKYYLQYDDIFNKLSQRIYNALKNRNVRAALDSKKPRKTGLEQKIDSLALMFVKRIETKITISPMDNTASDLILDFVLDSKYIDIYFNVITK